VSANGSLAPISALAALLWLLIMAPAAFAQDEEPEFSRRGADSCLACHEDQVTLAVFRTKHAVPGDERGPFGHGQLQCEACHGASGAHAGRVRRGEERPAPQLFAPGSTATLEQQNAACLGCHDTDSALNWHGAAHEANQVGCADCHSSHVARDPVLQTASQPAVCYDCHQLTRSDFLKPFAHPVDAGKMDCSGCHNAHGSVADAQLVRETVNQTCYQCHAEKRGPFLWEHAPAAEDCGACHSPHGSIHTGMLAQRGPFLCQSCHSQAGHPSVARDADGLVTNMPSALLLGQNCMNCHAQVHGSNHPSGSRLMR
jgi:DmsE family decaheme c-type cytochrome